MKGFVSYSHADSSIVDLLVSELNAQGVDLFFDKWDIVPGDSIINKIFEVGLAQAQLFIIVLSKNSVASNWVREELDTATVRKIEGVTRIVPVVIDDCDIPISLRALLWIDLRSNRAEGIRKIVNLVTGDPTRPPLGPPPVHKKLLKPSIGMLSPAATTIGLASVTDQDYNLYDTVAITGKTLSTEFGLTAEEVNDAVDELTRLGLIEPLRVMGTAPYEFAQISPTYMGYLYFKEILPYDPETDVKTIVSAIAAMGTVSGTALLKVLDSIGRLNRAVDYIADNGLARVDRFIGTAPFNFGQVTATAATRRAAKSSW